jgi:hypothetical protein
MLRPFSRKNLSKSILTIPLNQERKQEEKSLFTDRNARVKQESNHKTGIKKFVCCKT